MQKVLIFRKNDILVFTSVKPLSFKTGYFHRNIKELFKYLKIYPQNVVFAHQVHSNKIVVVKDNSKERNIREADGFITNKDNVLLLVFTADCLPVFIYDKVSGCIGITHCGWRGTYKEILRKAIIKLRKNYNVKYKNLKFIFGPNIKSCCYEVKENLIKKFRKKFGNTGLVKRGEKFYLDIEKINKYQIATFKIPSRNIRKNSYCTRCRGDMFFSFRRDSKTGDRMVSGIIRGY